MRWLLFLSRLAFICGICFLISLGFAMSNRDNNEPFSQTIITIGYFMGLIIVPVTDLCYIVVSGAGKKLRTIVPLWLVIANILFLFVLLFYIFYLNDPYYHQK
jgi:hypothetical protein